MSKMAESRDVRASRLTEAATRAFAKHEIRERSDRRWYLRSDRQNYWTEIVVLRGGSLLAHGDIAHVIWEHYGDSDDPIDVVHWIGQHAIADDYSLGKARIGTGKELIDTIDDAVFAGDLLHHMHEHGISPGRTEALSMLEAGEPGEQVLGFLLSEEGEDAEDLVRFGKVADARVYYAHAAVARLWSLLGAEPFVLGPRKFGGTP